METIEEETHWAEEGRTWTTGVGCMKCDDQAHAYVRFADGKKVIYGYVCLGCKAEGRWYEIARYYEY